MGNTSSCRNCHSDGNDAEVQEVETNPVCQNDKALGLSSGPDPSALQFLAQVKLFKRLPPEFHPVLAMACKPVTFEPGKAVITQGEEGHEFFMIQNGEASVLVGGHNVAVLKKGDYFGEVALLRDEPRNATIKAKTTLETLVVERDKFVELGLRDKLEFPVRKAVAGGGADEVSKPPSPKTDEERQLMFDAIAKNANLRDTVSVDEIRAHLIIDLAWKEEVKAGQRIIEEGDLNAQHFYIIQDGFFDVLVKDKEDPDDTVPKKVGTLGPGDSFGELALLYFAPRAATIQAKGSGILWVIARKDFKEILAKSNDEVNKEIVKILHKVEMLNPLKDSEKEEMSKALEEMIFSKDEVIFQQGEVGEHFYILVEGEVAVIKDGKEEVRLTANKEKAQYFGEAALLNGAPRGATIQVTSETAKTYCLDRTSFDMLLGPLEQLKKRGKDGNAKVEKKALAGVIAASVGADGKKRFGNIQKKDLHRLGLLGCGGFGAVELVEHKTTKESFAMKALSKGYVVKSGMQQNILSEKEVQLLCDSPFIIKLFETFNGSQSLYFLLEVALGGELYATYNKKGLFGKEAHCKFYAAGTLCAFEHMHSRKIVFRDLKPENLLLNEKGHIKVTDMGLAKVVIGKTYTTCGTPDYFAPELILSSGHSHAVDWWTLGILIFELMVGHPPFEAQDPMQIYQKVMKGITKVGFPAKVKGTIEDLIKNLCKKEPSERLAMKKGGASNIRAHAWYKGFQWEAFQNLSMDPPYKPAVKSRTDLANFHVRKEDMPPVVAYKDDGSEWDKDFATST